MDACEDVKPDQEVKAWRTPSTLWIPLLKVKTTVCLFLQLQTRLKNYKGNGENMPGAIVSLFLDCPQIYLAQEQSHGDTETSLATRLCKFEWALNFLQTHGLWCSDPYAILCSDCTLRSGNSTVENVMCPS